jgi:hypothetical protein
MPQGRSILTAPPNAVPIRVHLWRLLATDAKAAGAGSPSRPYRLVFREPLRGNPHTLARRLEDSFAFRRKPGEAKPLLLSALCLLLSAYCSWCFPIEGVDFLDARVAEEQRGIVHGKA